MIESLVTCTAPVNIAVIKYWGKRDEDLILPINDSLSVTLCSKQMHAKTTAAVSSFFLEDRLWLNGIEETIASNPRLVNCLREVRSRATKNQNSKVHICSENNFPTAAGLASSAAGYACLVYALCEVYGAKGDISVLARQGSGSACRSVFGGFVRWHAGSNPDGSDSVAKVVKDAHHWKDLKVLILVVNDTRKKVASTKGMQTSVATSKLLKYRAEHIVPGMIDDMTKAVEENNFSKFAEFTMKDSNQFHAVCLDTFPPCVYMNDVSHAICNLVHLINKSFGKNLVCYTFDAGPNACLFLPEENIPLVSGIIKHFFPPTDEKDFFRGCSIHPQLPTEEILSRIALEPRPNSIKYIIATNVGNGPEVISTELEDSCHLLNGSGLPKSLTCVE